MIRVVGGRWCRCGVKVDNRIRTKIKVNIAAAQRRKIMWQAIAWRTHLSHLAIAFDLHLCSHRCWIWMRRRAMYRRYHWISLEKSNQIEQSAETNPQVSRYVFGCCLQRKSVGNGNARKTSHTHTAAQINSFRSDFSRNYTRTWQTHGACVCVCEAKWACSQFELRCKT